jgi:2-methylcitrate dehydratase PrpD
MGGKAESTILGMDQKVPAPLAAFTNAFFSHARDFDDLHEPGGSHVNVSVIPAALATAEGKAEVSGKDLLRSIVLGVDLVCRLGKWIPVHKGWHVTSTYGVFGAALAAGLIKKMGPSRLVQALGLAYSYASGTRQGRLEGTLAKRIQPALASQGGVTATLLADQGITGPKEWIEGAWGLTEVYGSARPGLGKILEQLKADLGQSFLGDELSFKLYPCCKVTHTSIEATLDLVKENALIADEVECVNVRVSQGAWDTVGHPFQIRTNPQVDAQFSIPFTVALALTKGRVNLAGFEEKTIRDPKILTLAEKVHVQVDPEMTDESANMVNLAAKLSIETKRGTFSRQTAICKGHPNAPPEDMVVFDKFRDCARFGGSLSEKQAEEALGVLQKIEDVTDIGAMMQHMRSGRQG